MDPSSSQQGQPTVRHASRIDMRRAVYSIIRRVLMQRLAQQQVHGAPSRLNKDQRHKALRQARVLEDILYRRASSLDEYQDLSTLEQRVFKAGQAVYIFSQRREMEGQQGRLIRERVASTMDNYARGLENESQGQGRR